MKQVKEIYQGFKNLIKFELSLSDKDIETMSKLRYDICKECDKRNVITNTCKECGCYLPAKTRSVASECPLQHWDSIH